MNSDPAADTLPAGRSNRGSGWTAIGIVLGATLLGALIGSSAFGIGLVGRALIVGETVEWNIIEGVRSLAALSIFGVLPAFLAGLYLAIRYRSAGWIGMTETLAAAGLAPLAAAAISYVLAVAGAPLFAILFVAYSVFAVITVPIAILAAALTRPLLLRMTGIRKGTAS